ncbi:MAG: HEPN domain-containing protein [Deltaproteobacteria bacterium]|nr:HEPN domain-containing protein [Deltaproteobacteria bacterium]
MAFEWREFLRLAEDLVTRKDEAELRSAVSRAYYAAYHFARRRLPAELPKPNATESHASLWRAYLGSTNKAHKAIGVIGDRLREQRRRADYEAHFASLLKSGCTQKDAELAVKDAKALIDRLERM